MKPNKYLPHIISLEDNQITKFILPQISNKHTPSSPFSPKKLHKLKTQQKKKINYKNIHLNPQQIIQSRRSSLTKVGVFEMRQMMNNQAYLEVLKRLQRNHKYRQKVLLDKAINSRKLKQLLKKVQKQSRSLNYKYSHNKPQNQMKKQKMKTQQIKDRLHSVGLNRNPNDQQHEDQYLFQNTTSFPKIRRKNGLALKESNELKLQRTNKFYDNAKSLRHHFIINSIRNVQEEQNNFQQNAKLRFPTESLSEEKNKQINYKSKKQKMSMQTIQKKRNDDDIKNRQNKNGRGILNKFLSSKFRQKMITQQNDILEGWGNNQDEYLNLHYF